MCIHVVVVVAVAAAAAAAVVVVVVVVVSSSQHVGYFQLQSKTTAILKQDSQSRGTIRPLTSRDKKQGCQSYDSYHNVPVDKPAGKSCTLSHGKAGKLCR